MSWGLCGSCELLLACLRRERFIVQRSTAVYSTKPPVQTCVSSIESVVEDQQDNPWHPRILTLLGAPTATSRSAPRDATCFFPPLSNMLLNSPTPSVVRTRAFGRSESFSKRL